MAWSSRGPRDVGLWRGAEVRATLPGQRAGRRALRATVRGRPLPEGVDVNYVVEADYVTTDDGTGLVHQAPAFGEVDRQVAREYGLPTLNPVGPDGTFTRPYPGSKVSTYVTPTTRSTTSWPTRPLDPSLRLHALAAALLAMWHDVHLLGQAQLVRRDEPLQRATHGGERDRSTGIPRIFATGGWGSGWRTTSTGPSRAIVTGGLRCPSGAVARASHVRGVTSRTLRPRWSRPRRRRAPPPSYRRGRVGCPTAEAGSAG